MTDYDDPLFTCPKCGQVAICNDDEKVFGMSVWVCPEGHWKGDMPCGPNGHEEHDMPALKGKCRFCQLPMPDDDEEN